MAFDQTTRGRLQKFVNASRELLSEELTRQLQATYGLDPKTGTVADLSELKHLDNRERQTAQLLREILQHYIAATPGKNAKEQTLQALDRLVREQAFTVLNRMAALRMMEARDVLMESIAKGYNSRGFELYKMLSGTSQGETGDAYRNYLFSLFDEFSVDLELLFDRHGAQGRLFPRESALLELLEQINHPEIEHLWAEDETIGWIYQYFNSQEERKKMRKESQAPRNSRELAVRNQFFTPRYVVEFLVDNTLGRIWFDATQGNTSLYDRCQYLLVKPEELEAKRAEPTPRTLRDPRTLKLLDPACGSMHFGLYAFDLFLEIYREAWAWEQQQGPGSLEVSTQPDAGLKPLSQTYADEADYLRDVPRLIIEHNIYGVDIDPRAAQIATLALWLRAQRAWYEAGVKAPQRPIIGQGHVIAAIAPPAEKELRQQFAEQLDSKDAELFEKTLQLLHNLPELGVLLQVEQELPKLIKQVYGGSGDGLFAAQEQETWQQAEQRLRQALSTFTEQVSSSYQSRLFALDALQGLRLIDLTSEVFDVVVMNPPFGDAAGNSRGYHKKTYPNSHQDIFQCFVERSLKLARSNGLVGVLSARTGFFMGDSESWRTDVIWKNQLILFADLGLGVLDDALVEAAAYVVQQGEGDSDEIVASRHLSTRNKENSLLEAVKSVCSHTALKRNVFTVSQNLIKSIPGGVFGYWAPVSFLLRFKGKNSFHKNVSVVRQGLATADDFRFVRLSWEVPIENVGCDRRWHRFSKGGEYSPPYDDIHLLVDWDNDGKKLRCRSASRVQNDKWYHSAGATYTNRTASAFAAKILPKGCIFSHVAQSWFIDNKSDLLKSIFYFLCRAPQTYVELAVGGGDISTSGSTARRYTTKVVHSIPASVVKYLDYDEFENDCRDILRVVAHDQSVDETTCFFSGYSLSRFGSIVDLAHKLVIDRQSLVTKALRASWRIDQAVTSAWNLSQSEIDFVCSEVGNHPCEYEFNNSQEKIEEMLGSSTEELVRIGVEQEGASRWITKKSYFIDRKTELICHILKCCPESIEATLERKSAEVKVVSLKIISYAVGMAFGRWSSGPVDKISVENFIDNPFDELPRVPPAAQNSIKNYPILTSDLDNDSSLALEVGRALRLLFPSHATDVEEEIVGAIGSSVWQYLEREFFANHLSTYSKSRRRAPIYWPLSTASGSYTLWLYYHELTSQTLFTAVNDFVEPKLNSVRDDLNSLRTKGGGRSKQEEKELEKLEDLEQELADLRDTLLEIAPNYRPNQDDGVQITAAPLWSLFRHKPWQKVLKDTWKQLEKGDYDWAHLALNYWPDRVLRKCHEDRSLAIAHDVEEQFWEEVEVPVIRRGKDTGETKLEWQPKDLSEAQLQALINQVRQERSL
jgi:Eco57I restriction endonuclease.